MRAMKIMRPFAVKSPSFMGSGAGLRSDFGAVATSMPTAGPPFFRFFVEEHRRGTSVRANGCDDEGEIGAQSLEARARQRLQCAHEAYLEGLACPFEESRAARRETEHAPACV